MPESARLTYEDAKRHAYFEGRTFRGLWYSRRGGTRFWTVTYLNGDGEFEETEEFPGWREAVDAAIRANGNA